MERRSHLDQPLQERLLWLGRRQPHAFPGLMCGKELARLVQAQTFRQGPFVPIEFHILRPKLNDSYKLAWKDLSPAAVGASASLGSGKTIARQASYPAPISGSGDGCT